MDLESDMVVDIKSKCAEGPVIHPPWQSTAPHPCGCGCGWWVHGNPLHPTLALPDGSCLKQVQRQIATIEFSIKISVLILPPSLSAEAAGVDVIAR